MARSYKKEEGGLYRLIINVADGTAGCVYGGTDDPPAASVSTVPRNVPNDSLTMASVEGMIKHSNTAEDNMNMTRRAWVRKSIEGNPRRNPRRLPEGPKVINNGVKKCRL